MAAYQASGLVLLHASASLLWLLAAAQRERCRGGKATAGLISGTFLYQRPQHQHAHNIQTEVPVVPMDLSTCPGIDVNNTSRATHMTATTENSAAAATH